MMFWVMVGFACLIFMIKNPKILFGLMAFISFLLLLGKEYAALPVFALACLALWIIWLQEANDDNKNITDKPKYDKSIIHEKPPELPHNLKEHSPTIAPQSTSPQSESQASKERIQEIKEAIATMKRNAPVEHVEYSVSDYRRTYYNRLSNKERGKRYERYCGYLLAINGWEVEYSGIVLGNKDKGIDLRAFQEGRMKVAQCKFWSGRITNATVSQFIGDLGREQDENANLQVIGVFFCKENKFEEGCRERLEKKGISIQVQDYNNEYPCVKCILASKLYYTPYHAEYDTIRFSIQRGDRHCYDERLAETLGFKKAP